MKKLVLILGLVVGMMTTQAQSLLTFEVASKSNLNAYSWTEISSAGEQMQIADHCVEFVADNARMTHGTSITNHITKSPTRTSAEGQVIKGKLYSGGKVMGIARFAVVGTSMAGTADIDGNTYKFRPDKDGKYYWEIEAPFQCGTEDVDHNSELQNSGQYTYGAKENHQNNEFLSTPSSSRSPMDCTSESIQDVAFITDDLMTEYGNDLDAILAQIAISDSWAEDVMNDSGFPDISFFQESVHVVQFTESGTTWGNIQVFNDSLYATPPGVIATIMQNTTSSVTVLYSFGGGGDAGVATISVYPMPSGQYYMSVLGDNGGLGNRIKTHEYGHALWGGEHEDVTPNPVLYRRAYLGTDATWGNYATTMAQSNFGGGIRIYRFSDSDPNASWYSEAFDYTFSPVGNADRDMCRRITEEWNRPGIVQVVDMTPATPTISTDGSTTFCDGNSVTLSVDSIETGVDYIWSNGVTADSITVTISGSYSCYGQSSSTCTGGTSNVITVVVNALPTPTITGDLSFCDGSSTVLNAGSGYSTYLWNTGATTQTITVSAAGTYFVTVTNANGCEGNDQVTVTVHALPTPTITGDSVICDGSTGTLDAGSYASYLWSTGETTQTIDVTTAGTYSVDVTNTNGCEGSDDITVIVNPLPIPTITGDNELCEGTNGTYTTVPFSSYTWSIDPSSAGTIVSGQGTGTLVVNWTDSGDVLLDVTNSNGCEGSDTFSVTVNDLPIADAGTDQSISYGMSTTLNGSATGGNGNYVYSWTPANMVVDPSDPQTETVALTSPQTFTLKVTDGNACVSVTDDVLIDVTGGPLGLNPTASPNATCGNTEVQLSANAYGGTENYTYSWTSDPVGFTSTEKNPVDTPEETTTYICEVNDGNNTATSEVTVTVYDSLAADAASDMNLEIGQSVQFDGSFSGGSGDVTILWEGVNNSIPIDDPSVLDPNVGPFSDIDIYYFTLTVTDNITECESTDTMFVDVILGIDEPLGADDIKIYPNPTSGNIFINAQESLERVSIMNISGREVFHQENLGEDAQIDLSSLSPGLYFVRIYSGGVLITKKVAKR